jgi:hypothetical protein
MSLFGWSMPPGCSGTPYDESSAEDITALVIAIAPLPVGIEGVFWDEDGNVIETFAVTVPADLEAGTPEYKEQGQATVLTIDWEWLEGEGDDCAHNAQRAALAYVEFAVQGRPTP